MSELQALAAEANESGLGDPAKRRAPGDDTPNRLMSDREVIIELCHRVAALEEQAAVIARYAAQINEQVGPVIAQLAASPLGGMLGL